MITKSLDLAVIGGGASGYFGALRAAACRSGARITIFESGKRPLEKVRISGGGRCNVTHNCFEPAQIAPNYPRGSKELRAAFHRFQAKDTVEWFESRGIALKVEQDGRIFPTSDQSSSIIECLDSERISRAVDLLTETRIERIELQNDDTFLISSRSGVAGAISQYIASAILLATGNHRSGYEFAKQLGHTITPLAPSLFTFNVVDEELRALSGVSASNVALTLWVNGVQVAEHSGPLLITHWGVSGPAVLKLSAWAARELLAADYSATLQVDWTGGAGHEEVTQALKIQKEKARKTVFRAALFDLPSRLWEYIVRHTIPNEYERPWNQISNAAITQLVSALTKFELRISGKGQFKEEFVTCGGVSLPASGGPAPPHGTVRRALAMRPQPFAGCRRVHEVGEMVDVDGRQRHEIVR